MSKLSWAFALCCMAVQGCASAAFNEQLLNTAFLSCSRTTKASLVGSCAEAYVSQRAPNWTDHPRAQYFAALFSYVNRAGEKVEQGEWDPQRYQLEITSFINRLKIEANQSERAARAGAVSDFVRSLNSGITCFAVAPGMVRCQ
jgi:hypothetical protein